jgi:hypothetical protein
VTLLRDPGPQVEIIVTSILDPGLSKEQPRERRNKQQRSFINSIQNPKHKTSEQIQIRELPDFNPKSKLIEGFKNKNEQNPDLDPDLLAL